MVFTSVFFAQEELKFGQRFIVGTSMTYILERNEFLPNNYHEFTWNKNIAINITKSLYVGLSYQNIYTRGSSVRIKDENNNYNIFGAFLQYDFLPLRKDKLGIELSWNYGNYCTCGSDDPYKNDGLNYIGIGGGYERPITKLISAEVGFYLYDIIGKVENKYAFTQYIVGLNFDLINK